MNIESPFTEVFLSLKVRAVVACEGFDPAADESCELNTIHTHIDNAVEHSMQLRG